MRTLVFAALVLTIALPAHARRYIAVGIPGPRIAGTRDGTLKESSIGTRTDAVLGAHETHCPHTSDPNPTFLVILDPAQPLDEGEWIAEDLARHGYAAVLLAPGPLPTSAQVGEMLDAIAGGAATTPLEHGCTPDGKLGLYGNLRAGALVLAAAREREAAGHPVDLVVAVLAGDAPGPDATPTLLVDGPRRERGNAKLAVIDGLTECELHVSTNPCWKRFDTGDDPQRARNIAVRRQLAVGEYALKFVRGTLDHDEFAAYDFHDGVVVRTIDEPPSGGMWGPPEWRSSYSVPIMLGATFAGNDTTQAASLRPELLYLRVRDGIYDSDTHAIGVGVYGEVARLGDATAFGSGVTFALGSGRLGFTSSVGYTRRATANGLAGSVFVGLLDAEDLEHNNLATGFRLDARRYGSETQVTASFQMDLALPVLAYAAIAALIDKASHH